MSGYSLFDHFQNLQQTKNQLITLKASRSKLAQALISDDFNPPDLILRKDDFLENPTLIFDLGGIHEIEECVLVPSANPNFMDYKKAYGFPGRFSIQTSLDPNFKVSQIIYQTPTDVHLSQGITPFVIPLEDKVKCRYISLNILEWFPLQDTDIFSLAEWFVFSDGVNIALHSQCINRDNISKPSRIRRLVDGKIHWGFRKRRSVPSDYLGWRSKWSDSLPFEETFSFDFGNSQTIDQLKLYPALHGEFPNHLHFEVERG